MSPVLQAFEEGGWPMYLVLAVDSCFAVVAVVALALAVALRGSTVGKVAAAGLGACALLPLLIGVGGYTWGMQRVTEAVTYADPEFREQLMVVGRSEAMNNLWFGAGSLMCTLPVAAVVLMAAFLGGKQDV